jgi:hypothetical protein
MAPGWNEIKERAVKFTKEWENAFNEEADAKQFLIEFLIFLESVTGARLLLSAV